MLRIKRLFCLPTKIGTGLPTRTDGLVRLMLATLATDDHVDISIMRSKLTVQR